MTHTDPSTPDAAAPAHHGEQAYAVAVGAQLRATRRARGWTQAGLVAGLAACGGAQITKWTLGAIENGTRTLTVPRFLQLCAAMGVSPLVVLDAALRRLPAEAGRSGEADSTPVRVHLPTLRAAAAGHLAPLARWANLPRAPQEPEYIVLDATTLAQLATVTALSVPNLRAALGELGSLTDTDSADTVTTQGHGTPPCARRTPQGPQ